MFPIYSESQTDDDNFIFVKMETQGWRPSMEDFILLQKIDGLNENEIDDIFGIFDGHGGYLVSLFCKTVMPNVVSYNLKLVKSKVQGAANITEQKIIKYALKKSIQDLDLILQS